MYLYFKIKKIIFDNCVDILGMTGKRDDVFLHPKPDDPMFNVPLRVHLSCQIIALIGIERGREENPLEAPYRLLRQPGAKTKFDS